MAKPRIFIGSSSEALDIARGVELHLSDYCQTTLWRQGVFKLSRSVLEDLEKAVVDHEFAVLILTPDDTLVSRGEESRTPRDNILFELGMFVGSLGRNRTFVVCDPERTKIPSDLFGVTVASFDWQRARDPKETTSAVSPACTKILEALRSVPRVPKATPTPEDRIGGVDELHLAIAQRSSRQSSIVILHHETSWAWKLFPTVLEWTLSGIPVTIFLSSASGDQKQLRQERYRRKLFRNLGARVLVRKSIPFTGFFFDANEENSLEVLLITQDTSGYKPLAFKYDANTEREAAQALLRSAPRAWRDTEPAFRPSLCERPAQEVCSILASQVSQYRQYGVNITPCFVPTGDVNVISRYTRAYKYQQIECLANHYRKLDVEPFKPLGVTLKDGSCSIITPPVVERTPDGLVAVEGNTRATYCLQNGVKDFFCLLVEGVSEPLPGTPWPVTEVKVSERTLPPEERIDAFDYARFRHIERAIHPY